MNDEAKGKVDDEESPQSPSKVDSIDDNLPPKEIPTILNQFSAEQNVEKKISFDKNNLSDRPPVLKKTSSPIPLILKAKSVDVNNQNNKTPIHNKRKDATVRWKPIAINSMKIKHPDHDFIFVRKEKCSNGESRYQCEACMKIKIKFWNGKNRQNDAERF